MKYKAIVIDPPWEYPHGWPAWNSNGKRKGLEYPTMTIEEIKALPVYSLVEHEYYIFLWTTNRYLETAFEVVRHWRCVPRQVITWCKPPRGKGPGGLFANTTEFVVSAQRIGPNSHGRIKVAKDRIDSTWFEWPRGRHSEKPEAFQDLIEGVLPGPYLEMFARRYRLGWNVWGNEVDGIDLPVA